MRTCTSLNIPRYYSYPPSPPPRLQEKQIEVAKLRGQESLKPDLEKLALEKQRLEEQLYMQAKAARSAQQQEATSLRNTLMARTQRDVEEAFNMRCPNAQCKTVVSLDNDLFEGCGCIKCGNCRQYFCAFCLGGPFGGSEQGHRHVARCNINPNRNS